MYESTNIKNIHFPNKLRSFKKPLLNFNNKLVIYGAGDMCKMALGFFKLYDLRNPIIIDKKVKKIESNYVFGLYKLKVLNKDSNICICISNKDFFTVYKKLKSMGFKNIYHFYDFSEKLKKNFYLSNGWFVNKKTKINSHIKFSKIFFADQLSFKFYLNFLLWHVNREFIKNIKPDRKIYINDITKKFFQKNNSLYLDVGTGYGKSLSKILKKDIFKKIICIDGCGKVAKHLKKKYNSIKRVKILKKVISNKRKKLKFYDKLYHVSKVSRKGSITYSQSIDEMSINPSVIKIHTEGEELNVLKGSIKTINRCLPLLMINVYHNSDGIIKIFKLMENYKKKYKFYLRGYSLVGTNYVLYCVPRKI